MSRKKLIITAVILALVVLIGGLLAYFTDKTETLNNVFTVGNVKITLTESKWNAENGKEMTPNKVVEKNPTITNVGGTNAYVFAKLEVPTYVDEQSNTKEIFTYDIDNTKWIEVGTPIDGTNTRTHIYAYATSDGTTKTMTKLAKDGTAVLFNNVTFLKDYSGKMDVDSSNNQGPEPDEAEEPGEGTGEGTGGQTGGQTGGSSQQTESTISISSSLQINVTAYAIQTEDLIKAGTTSDKATSPTDVFNILKNEISGILPSNN